MRRHLLALLDSSELEYRIDSVSEADLTNADEVFLTNSQMGAIPVTRCGDNTWPVGPVTRQVMSLLADNGVLECRL